MAATADSPPGSPQNGADNSPRETPPLVTPDNMDSTVADLLIEEHALQQEMAVLRGQLQSKRDEKEQLQNPANAELMELDKTIAVAAANRDTLKEERRRKTHQATSSSMAAKTIQEHLTLYQLQKGPLEQEVERLRVGSRAAKAKAEKLKADTERLKPRDGDTRSPVEMEREIGKLDKKIDEMQATDPRNPVLHHYRKERSGLQKDKKKVDLHWDALQGLFEVQKEEKDMTTKLKAQEKKLNELNRKHMADEKKRGELPTTNHVEDRAEVDALSSQIAELDKELNRHHERKRKLRADAYQSGNPLGEGIGADIRRRNEIRERLDKINTEIPKEDIIYDRALQSVLIGPRGATIHQLQEDYGVSIKTFTVNAQDGRVQIRGGKDDVATCSKAIGTMMARAKDSRHQATMVIEESLCRAFIGPRGSHIQAMEANSGARVKLDSTSCEIVLTGTVECVDLAKKLIEEFKEQNHRIVIPATPAMRDHIVGIRGSEIQKMEAETAVRNISLQNNCTELVITGPKENCLEAEKRYKAMLDGFTEGEEKVPVDIMGAIVGAGGSTKRKIESDTGAKLDLPPRSGDGPPTRGGRGRGGRTRKVEMVPIKIRGSKIAVEAARACIFDIMRENAREESTVKCKPEYIHYLRARPADPDQLGPLERIKREAGSAPIMADVETGILTVAGKRAAVQQAKELLQAEIRRITEAVQKVKFPPPVFALLIRKVDDDGGRYIQQFSKETNCSAKIDKPGGVVLIISDKKEITVPAAEKLRAIVKEAQGKILTLKVDVPERSRGFFFGYGGSMRNVQQEYRDRVEITVDEESKEIQLLALHDDDTEVAKRVFQELDRDMKRLSETPQGAGGIKI